MSHETDHEFRLRMAAEGRAIYLPGKTIEEIAAERAQDEKRRAQQTARIVTLSEGDWSELDVALPDVFELVNDLGNIFSMLAWAEDLDQPWITSMLKVAARAVRSMEDKELAALDRLDTGIRQAKQEGK